MLKEQFILGKHEMLMEECNSKPILLTEFVNHITNLVETCLVTFIKVACIVNSGQIIPSHWVHCSLINKRNSLTQTTINSELIAARAQRQGSPSSTNCLAAVRDRRLN